MSFTPRVAHDYISFDSALYNFLKDLKDRRKKSKLAFCGRNEASLTILGHVMGMGSTSAGLVPCLVMALVSFAAAIRC